MAKKRPAYLCFDRVIDDPFDRMRLAALAAEENPANAPRGDLVDKAMLSAVGIAFITNSLWKTGRTLRVFFMGGTAAQQTKAKAAAAEIEANANLKFSYVATAGESDIRISFNAGSGAWSYIGTDALGIPKNQATMNLGFDQGGTYVHEFLHAIGAVHEHQHPEAGIVWNEPVVYADYAGEPNFWDREKTKHNVIDRYSRTVTQFSAFDPKSVMLYPVDARHTLNGFSAGWNVAMSQTDREWLAKTYPKADGPVTPPVGITSVLSINVGGRQVSGTLNADGTVTGSWNKR